MAHYALDEPAGSGNPVFDSAGTNDGTLTGTPVQGVPGRIGTAYDFNAGSDGIDLGGGSALKPTDDFTVTFWFRPDSFSSDTSTFQYERIVDATGTGGGIAAGYRVMLNKIGSSSRLTFLVRNATSAPRVVDTTPLVAGQWYFGAARYDKDDQFSIALYDPSTSTTTSVSSTSSTTAIDYGAASFDVYAARSVSGNAFDTALDDLAFWDTVLADDELAYVATYGAAAPVPTLHWNAQDAPVNDGGRDEWLPRVGTGFDWNFENANGPDRVNAEGVYTPITHAYRYTGDENVRFSNTADNSFAFDQLNSSASASFEMWFRPDALDNGQQVLWETGGVNGASLTLDDDLLRFGTASSSGTPNEVEVLYTLSQAEAERFVQVVGVYDKETTETRLYVDGLLVGTVDDVTSNWSGVNSAGLGTSQDVTGGFAASLTYGRFVGDIAIFNFYGYALGDAQVQAAFQAVAVPEPGSVVLLGVGLLGLCGTIARRRRSTKRC